MASLFFDDLVVGRSWTSPSRTVTEADVGDFAGLTGDRFPLHTSEEYARSTPFGTRIAHGLLGLTFAHGLMWARTGELDEAVIAFLGIKDWEFLAPLHFGATIHVEYAVTEQRPSSSKPDRGVVTFDVRVLDADGTLLQRGTKSLLLRRKPSTMGDPR
jgi:acyl dehydratase